MDVWILIWNLCIYRGNLPQSSSAVYTPPQVTDKVTLDGLYLVIKSPKTTNTGALRIITGDVTQENFRSVLPSYHQPVSPAPHGVLTL